VAEKRRIGANRRRLMTGIGGGEGPAGRPENSDAFFQGLLAGDEQIWDDLKGNAKDVLPGILGNIVGIPGDLYYAMDWASPRGAKHAKDPMKRHEVVGTGEWFANKLGARPYSTTTQWMLLQPFTGLEDLLLGGAVAATKKASKLATKVGPKTSAKVAKALPNLEGYVSRADYPQITPTIRGTTKADDYPVEMTWERQHLPPPLTRASKGIHGQIAGAPPDVHTRADELSRMESFLERARKGAKGRHWYDEEAEMLNLQTGNLAYDRPNAAGLQGQVYAHYSPRTAVTHNELARVKATNQNAVGAEVHAGTADRDHKAITSMMTGNMGAGARFKTEPFSGSVSKGTQRGVQHTPYGPEVVREPVVRSNISTKDFRHMRNWGYPEKQSPGPSQHRWMQRMDEEAVAEANARKLGGYDDWDLQSLQAAAWVFDKAKEMKVSVEELAAGGLQGMRRLEANIYHEHIPSNEMLEAPMPFAEAQAMTRANEAIYLNPQGTDALLQQQQLLPAWPTRMGEGIWEGKRHPNVITTMLGASSPDTVIEPSTRTALEFNNAMRGLMDFQADIGWSYLRPAPTKGKGNAYIIKFDRNVGPQDIKAVEARVQMDSGFPVVQYRSDPRELEVTYIGPDDIPGPPTPKVPKKGGRGFTGGQTAQQSYDQNQNLALQNRGKQTPMVNPGGLMTGASEYKPSNWMQFLQNPQLREAVAPMIPDLVRKKRALLGGMPFNDKGRALANKVLDTLEKGGLDAVEAAIRSGALPVFAVGWILAGLGDPESIGPSQGLLNQSPQNL
jgi:hypothetical protein